MKKLAEWISIKKIAVAVGFAFFASMVPNWLLAFIARPSGDDYGYSAASHQAWLHTHSVIEVLRTGLETTKHMCQVWNGDWFSVYIYADAGGLCIQKFLDRTCVLDTGNDCSHLLYGT